MCSFCAASTQQPPVLLAVHCLVHMDIFVHLSGLYPPVKYIESFLAAPTRHVLFSQCLMLYCKRKSAFGTDRLTWTPHHSRGGIWCCLYAQIFHFGACEFFPLRAENWCIFGLEYNMYELQSDSYHVDQMFSCQNLSCLTLWGLTWIYIRIHVAHK